MLISSHLHGHDIRTIVYNGFCEVVNDHYHPIFLLFFVNRHTKNFWVITEVLDNMNGHSHLCELSGDEIGSFIKNKEVAVATSKYNVNNHQHKVFFNINQKQKSPTQKMIDDIIFLEV